MKNFGVPAERELILTFYTVIFHFEIYILHYSISCLIKKSTSNHLREKISIPIS